MNLLQELRWLDPRDPGRWPLAVRAGAIAVCFVVRRAHGLITSSSGRIAMPQLQQREDQEQQLRNEFQTKHAKAVNLALYKQQLADIEKSFGALLRQLPSKTEVPNLLVDISQTGLAAALQEKLFQPGPEIKKDFYAELPIKIRLTGSYHQFGRIRQRHRGAAAHRHAARHRRSRRSRVPAARAFRSAAARCDRQDLSLPRRRRSRRGGGRQAQGRAESETAQG